MEYRCNVCGHQFNEPKTVGAEWTETDVCPKCHKDNFDRIETPENEGIILVELFSGIGGFHKAILDSGIKIKKCYFSEIDKHAIANYKYNFPNAEYIGSVKDVSGTSIRERHPNETIIVTFGWPCQDNSIAGKRKGQRIGTRSGLLFEAGRIIKECQCEYFIAENVKGLFSVNAGIDFYEAIRFLTYLDSDSPQYTVEMQLLNTSWVLPQNRERTYFIGHSRKRSVTRIFPIGETGKLHNKTGSEESGEIASTLNANDNKSWVGNFIIQTNTKKGFEQGDSINFSVPNSKTRRGRVGKQVSQTLDTSSNIGTISNGSIRRLTEIEVEKLQGFEPNWTKFGNYDGTIKQIPKTQRCKLIGNAVTKNIVELIAVKLKQQL